MTMTLRRGKAQNRTFAAGGRPRAKGEHSTPYVDIERVREVRVALEQSGPLFSCVGRYLSARIDLLAPEICEELRKIQDYSPVTPAAAISAVILTEFGYSPETLFLRFDLVPFESRLLFQSHRAVLADGTRVVVRVIHPELNLRIDESGVMPLIEAVIADFTAADTALLMRDFRFYLEQQLNCKNTAEALQKFRLEAHERGTERTIEAKSDFCSSRVLTFTDWGARSVHEVLEADRVPQTARGDLARTIITAWMRHSLLGDAFPIEPDTEDIAIFMPYTAAFTATGAASLSDDSRTALWQYLVAAAADDSDKACLALLRALAVTDDRRIEDELKKRFRQIVAFRDGGWPGPAAYGFAERLFTQWKAASDLGLLPDSALAAFYRGLYTVYLIAHRIAPDQDNLLHAWREVRLTAGLDRMREMLTPDEMTALMDRYIGALAEFPDRMDEVLTLGAQKSDRSAYIDGHRQPHPSCRSSAPYLTALLLLLSAAALFAHRFAAGSLPRSIAVILFVVTGFVILRIMQRMK